MESQEIRTKFLKFFESREHKIVPSSSLVPDDPSVLLTTAGMQQFKKYYTEPSLAPVKNVVSIQKCFRTSDIDEVGDNLHLTFFEMLGNFSFGGYWKKEAIEYAYEFLTKELGLKIDYVSVFAGDNGISADEESEKIWKSVDSKIEIKKFGKKDNFWGPTGSLGPCGPTTEIYINGVEVWNLVFNEFFCHGSREMLLVGEAMLEPLETKGIDTGMGLERLAMIVQGKKNIFETNLFKSFIDDLPQSIDYIKFPERKKVPISVSNSEKRIIVDHARAIVFLISDGVFPSNKDAGYILRRIIRRYITKIYTLGDFYKTIENIIDFYKIVYSELDRKKIMPVFEAELSKFLKTLDTGLNELYKIEKIDAKSAFKLFESFGLPYEVIKEEGGKIAESLTREDFDKEFKKHQEISRAGAEKKFGGHGLLLNTGELKAKDKEELKKVTCLHTATHLLQAALRKILGEEVKQMGSDITAERTRFDFSYSRKPTNEELKEVENVVNDIIAQKLSVNFIEMPIEEAKETGALHFFSAKGGSASGGKEKYPENVKVYYVGESLDSAFSKEFCGGPHVKNTSEIGHFKIQKSESIGSSIRRIRGIIIK